MSAGPGSAGGSAWSAGDVVWVKLGSCWWPGSVADVATLPPDLLRSVRKPPLAIVHFFQEDYFEFVRNEAAIYPYNCSRKEEFIKKGLDMYRGKQSHNMDKFPEDVIRAEELTDGDLEILTRPQYQQEKKESYAGLFGEAARAGSRGRGRGSKRSVSTPSVTTPRSTPNKKSRTPGNYKAHILVQGSPAAPATPTISQVEPAPTPTTPAASTPGLYTCHACWFSSSRLNVMILHTKSHSVDAPRVEKPPSAKKQYAKKTPKQTAGKKRVAQRTVASPSKKTQGS